jgi:hypothetical protein
MNMKEYVPGELPEVDAVEVVHLRGINPDNVDAYMALAGESRCWVVEGERAKRIAELWRGLIDGEGARCHVPRFGFRFRNKGVVVLEASVCWMCNNIYGNAGERKVFFEFEASEEGAQSLLREVRDISGVLEAERWGSAEFFYHPSRVIKKRL